MPAWLPLDGRAPERLDLLGARLQGLEGLGEAEPLPAALVPLRPLGLLLRHRRLVELVERLGRILGDLLRRAGLGDLAQVVVDVADDAGFLPGLALRRLGTLFVGLPAAFGKDPFGSSSRLDQKHTGLLLVRRHDASDEALATVAVACWKRCVSRAREECLVGGNTK